MKYCSILLLLSSVGCTKPKADIEAIRNNYSAEVLNYFYEVALHSEADSNKKTSSAKWNKDILVYMNEDTPLVFKNGVLNTIAQLNRLQLPIQLLVTADKQKATMHVYFGSRDELELQDNIGGQGLITQDRDGWIASAVVKIPVGADQPIPASHIESIVLEEITQCLGTIGDSYLYPMSVFYERPNSVRALADIDKQVLRLLYDSAMPVGYSSEQFERDFAKELYHVNSEEKLLRYLQKQSVSQQTVEQIIQHGLIASDGKLQDQAQIIKFTQPIAVTVQGDTTARHLSLLQQAVHELNQASDQLQLHLAFDSLPHDDGLHYHFKQVDKLEDPTGSILTKVSTHHTKQLLFHRRFTTDIHITYKDTVALQEKMPMAIATTLYQTISLLHQPAPLFFIYQDDSLQLRPEYQEILRTYYAPELANNMTKAQLENVLALMP